MFRIPNDISARDVAQWINGSWAVCGGQPFEVTSMAPDDTITVRGISLEGTDVSAAATDCYTHWPTCGSINLGYGVACNVIRIPSKAYNRSYSARQVEVMVPSKFKALLFFYDDPNLLHKLNNLQGNSPDVVRALFNPTYPSPQEAMRRITEDDSFSEALSPTCILTSATVGFEVHYRGKYVGNMHNGDFTDHSLDRGTEVKLRKTMGLV